MVQLLILRLFRRISYYPKNMNDKIIAEIPSKLEEVLNNIAKAANDRPIELINICPHPRLVGVTKTKSKHFVMQAYKAGQRHFGENYVKELLEKSSDPELISECPDIKWHMIGPLQSNKIKKVICTPSLFAIETIHNAKIADEVNKRWTELNKNEKLNVFIQVNTSMEEAKSGVLPEKTVELYSYVLKNCPNLNILGLMTIGALNHDYSVLGQNPDFTMLKKCRETICSELALEPSSVELSMGMSNDYQHAVNIGSTNVRVGSLIFGPRVVVKLP